MTETVTSKNGVAIRLTDERWTHITEEDAELAGFKRDVLETVAQPEQILAGGAGELLALRACLKTQLGGSSSISFGFRGRGRRRK